MLKKVLAGGSVALLPMLVFAQSTDLGYFTDLVENIQEIVNGIIPIVIGLAVIYFIYGLISYMMADDDDKKKAARSVMLYGVIAIAVMVSIWGLVNLLQDIFGIDSNANINIPTVPTN